MSVLCRMGFRAIVIGIALPFSCAVNADPSAPLSVIDWLNKPNPKVTLPRAPTLHPQVTAKTPLDEPAVTDSGAAPKVTTSPLGTAATRNVGLVPPSVTGIKPDLWAGSDPVRAAHHLKTLPELVLPASNALLFTILLTEASVPSGAADEQDTLTLARILKLETMGAVDPAMALAEQAGAQKSRNLFDVWSQLSMFVGTEDTACGVLSRAPYLTKDAAIQIFCAARGGDWDTAMLTFGSAKALSLIPREKIAVLDRFLNPDFFEEAEPLPPPRKIDPLTFRLFETIGEPLSTSTLPRSYAVADLRDVAGWKSQLEAAERLTRVGALPDNHILGLYSNRKPAASGGIWDRVKAIQRFDTALSTDSADAVSKTLPAAWREMEKAQLEVSFATSFYERLEKLELTGTSAKIKERIGLLSPAYETVAVDMDDDLDLGPDTPLLRAVAVGEGAAKAPTSAVARAIHDAFSTPSPNTQLIEMAKSKRLGEALISTLALLRDGARGDSLELREALSTLRALGLEDTARRAALQILLLERTQ